MTRPSESTIRLCLAAQMFYPTYGGSTLRFPGYLPEMMHNMGIASRIEVIQNGVSLQTGARKTDIRGMSGPE